MTSTEMLSNLRTKLDEAAAGFWTDIECYTALTNGQMVFANLSLAIFKVRGGGIPEVLSALTTNVTDTTDSSKEVAIPADFMHLINAELATVPCSIVPYDSQYKFRQANTYLKSDAVSPFVSVIGTKIRFTTATTAVDYNYLKLPTDIDASTQPILLGMSHSAIVIYAFAELLKKAKRQQEAAQNFNQFIELTQGVN